MTDRNDRWGDLLRRANRGDGQAYAAFLTEIAPVLRTVVRGRGGDGDEVEDVLQEVLLAIHAKRHTWREADPVTPWLYAIARYKTVDIWRRRRGGAAVPIDDLAEVLPEDPVDVTAARDLSAMLGRIDDRAAEIVRAVGIEGLSAGEAGARFGMSEGAVRVAYHRAMQRLKEMAETKDATRE
ncbi:RNA polymerase sigma-70 factor [Oceanicola sp. 22II-s10i]|uniref:sigma-70 family RNA polymerase sigma factor n=1 Tax=Oceanicola sp. 22II-s10i TaxID=1317116 RepID=UPI000B51F70E|nr:sigma-70 family RNA polymerase sigma factor [Oceanicola sp. 22II-s10i]OWU85106.1 RNA polymerase sigma-70 factor [Oceanicola sp. 22II-s10i]